MQNDMFEHLHSHYIQNTVSYHTLVNVGVGFVGISSMNISRRPNICIINVATCKMKGKL